MPADVAPPPDAFPVTVDVLIVGAGAAGLVAALAASEAGETVVVLERDATPAGSTALSAGLIPAAGTTLQKAAGIDDTVGLFAADIQKKAAHENDAGLVDRLARTSAEVIEWLAGSHGLPFTLVNDFDYPGHSRRRMHGLPSRTGRELVDALRSAVEAVGADILCEARVTTIFAEGRDILGVAFARPDGSVETVGCKRLVLACSGFGGNRSLVEAHIPEIRDALWFGHSGNVGDALEWGRALGAATAQLSAYQGHGNVAHPDGILITWAVIMGGGIQVNVDGRRFWDEGQGYSEAARAVLAQPGGIAWTIFDETRARPARQFADYLEAERAGAIVTHDTLDGLARRLGLPEAPFEREVRGIATGKPDRFGRIFQGSPLSPPYHGVRVTGALFHTQGGLVTGEAARVVGMDGAPFPNLHAAGGAAVGVSGNGDSGYLSGNGLLAAVCLGYLAGRARG